MLHFRSRITLLTLLVGVLTLSSCIKDEAPNAEADITGVSFEGDNILIRQPEITNNTITLYANTNDSILAPQFTLTEGATIEPASGTPRVFFRSVPNPQKTDEYDGLPDSIDVAVPQTYTVTSQDGQWKKTYTVRVANNATPSDFHFDDIKYYMYDTDYDGVDDSLFQTFYETIGGNQVEWGSGNSGVMITFMGMNPRPTATDYPTTQSPDGYSGACAKLQTVSTGELGKMFGSPIAAGNIFLGSFQIDMAHQEKSTHFGIPFYNTKPVSFSGYYKYKAGPTYTDKQMNTVDGRKDDFAIYAVVFEPTNDVPWLDGGDGASNALTSPTIVLKAELTDRHESDEWVHFDIPFETMNGKTFDYQKMIQGRYSIVIVASSSKDGAFFNGAVGSTLYIDEFHINYE